MDFQNGTPCGLEKYDLWQEVKASLVTQMVKDLPAVQETWAQSLGWEDPLEKEIQPTPVFLPAKSHGQRSLVGDSPWGHKESHTTERINNNNKLSNQGL